MGQGASSGGGGGDAGSTSRAYVERTMKAVQQEMDAGHRAYTTLRCFQRLFDLIEKPSECDIVQCGWQAYCKRLQGAAKAASLLFDGKRTEALGLARIREQREARTTYEFESFHGKFTRSPAAAV